MNITSGEAVCKMLNIEGVDTVFGIIDGTYMGLIASLESYGIKLITPRHETSAAHMAGAYARLTGKLGVCIASNGPGVANILPGVAVENAEGNRVLLITSCRRPTISYPDRGGTYQYFDQTGVIGKMSKYSQAVSSEGRLVETMRQAFRKSWEGRPGIVHVDIPENFMNSKSKFNDGMFIQPENYRKTRPTAPAVSDVETAAEMLINAKHPIIHAGSGVIHSQCFEELELVANLLHIPVTTSWGARGALCESNELSIPMIHVEANNDIRSDSDLVLILGSRVSETDWWGKMPNWAGPSDQKTIQVDLSEDCIGRNKPIDLGIHADVKVFLRELYTNLKTKKTDHLIQPRKSWFQTYLDKMQKHREKLDKHLEDVSVPMNTAHVMTTCKQVFKDNSIAVFDGGNTAVWGQFFYKCTSSSPGLGTPKMGMLGAGQGQALGAKVACPDKNVFCVIGDGAMGFHMQEVETAIRNDLNVIFLVVCDKQWGMVKMTQQFALRPIKTIIKKSLDEGETINADFGEIKFDDLARSMGAHGERVADPKDLPAAIERCIDSKICSIIHVDVNPVKHMWAPSLVHFKKMHEEPAGK